MPLGSPYPSRPVMYPHALPCSSSDVMAVNSQSKIVPVELGLSKIDGPVYRRVRLSRGPGLTYSFSGSAAHEDASRLVPAYSAGRPRARSVPKNALVGWTGPPVSKRLTSKDCPKGAKAPRQSHVSQPCSTGYARKVPYSHITPSHTKEGAQKNR